MSIEIFWQLPIQGDGRSIHPTNWQRGDFSAVRKQPHAFARTGVQRDGYTYYDHLSQIVGAAEVARFDGVWIPHSSGGEDPLIVAGAFVRETRHVKFAPSMRTPLLSAVYATKIANSFQRLSRGRLIWNLATEADQPHTWHGRHWGLDEQVARTREFIEVAKGFWNQAPFTYKGAYYEVENGGFAPALQGPKLPLIYLSGESEAALALSAEHADVHILPLESLAKTRERIRELDQRAAAHGRTLAYALAADIVAREDNAAAWNDLRTRWNEPGATTIPISPEIAESNPPINFDDFKRGDNLWLGFAQVRPGGGGALVGGYEDVAARVAEYVEAGVGHFIFNANPALEEAYHLGERLLPRIRALTVPTRKAA
jgi:alkanesulfonate monooxygenase